MAIAEMKRVSLLALSGDKPRLLARMQQLGCVQVVERRREGPPAAQDGRESARLRELTRRIERLDLAILRLGPHDSHRQGALSPRRVAGADQVAGALAARGEIMAIVDRAEAIERTRGELRAQLARLNAQIEAVAPWEGLTVPLDRLGPTKTSVLLLASVPQRHMQALQGGAERIGAVQWEEVSRAAGHVNLLIAAHGASMEPLERLLGDCQAARAAFPDLTGTASLALEQLRAKRARIGEVRAQLDAEFRALADQLPVLRVLRDAQALERDQLQSALRTENTRCAFLLTGWAPADRAERLEAELKRCAPLCELAFSDPGEGESPPTLLRNPGLVSPFESIVRLFSLPDPHGVDPTLAMMPFWMCFFGMMLSDAGYGLILGLGAAYLSHRLGRRSEAGNLAFILMMGALSTVFWGAMYGGWFAIEAPWISPILFSPMDEPLKMIALCMGVGAVHIFAGLGMAARLNFRRGRPLDALYDQFSWMMLLVGLGLLAVSAPVGLALAGAGGSIILFMAGRAQKGPVRRALHGLGALYGLSGFAADLLSYVRLFGMGLATGVIGMVFNTLAALLWGSPAGKVGAVALLLIGHTFNLVINALGAYVHSCRLQFIEFFGKFYEFDGRDFTPLRPNTRYVDIETEHPV